MICTNCGQQNKPDMKFCTSCRSQLNQRSCSNGHPIPDGLDACPYCPRGQPQPRREPTELEPPSKPPVANGTRVIPPDEQARFNNRRSSTVDEGRSLSQEERKKKAPKHTTYRPQNPTMNPLPPGGGDAQANASSGSGPTGVSPAAHRPPLVGFLVSFSADRSGEYWPLRFGRTTIGREEGSSVCLDFPDVSVNHAIIMARTRGEDSRVWLEDCSTNGTQVNGQDIFNDRPSLSHGDLIQVGSVSLKLVLLD